MIEGGRLKGVALTATYEEIDKLLYLVENVAGYRDWDWLDWWLCGESLQTLSINQVIGIYASDSYWRAVEQGNVEETERIRVEILGTN